MNSSATTVTLTSSVTSAITIAMTGGMDVEQEDGYTTHLVNRYAQGFIRRHASDAPFASTWPMSDSQSRSGSGDGTSHG